MSRSLLFLSVALSLSGGALGGWLLRDWNQAQIDGVPQSEEWSKPTAMIPGLTIPAAFPTPPVDDADPAPIHPPGSQPSHLAQAGQAGKSAAPERVTTDLLFALRDEVMTGEFRGNGRHQMRLMMVNRAQKPVRLSIPAGQVFKGVHGTVLSARAAIYDFAPGESRLEDLSTLAVSSMNRVEESAYMPTEESYSRLDALLRMLEAHPEVPIPTAQTAALAILENLPASSVAKFAASEVGEPQPWDTTAFRVETSDLIGALAILRKIGLPDQQVVMTIDPQTRIEAMLDPLARAQAMHYYGITPDREWAYWKNELLEGSPRTRHYALHGIARYFPEVALKMLPSWVREKRTSGVFRSTAITALTETRRPEALEILQALQIELVDDLELSMMIAEAATYMETTLERAARRGVRRIGFRADDYEEIPPVPQVVVHEDLSPLLALVDEVMDEATDRESDEEAEEGEGLDAPDSLQADAGLQPVK